MLALAHPAASGQALGELDELQLIRSGLSAGITTFARKTNQCDDSDLAEEAKPFAPKLFQSLDTITPTDDLWMVLDCDDYTVYRTLFELRRSGRIVSVANHAGDLSQTEALEDITEFILSENELDDKCSLTSGTS